MILCTVCTTAQRGSTATSIIGDHSAALCMQDKMMHSAVVCIMVGSIFRNGTCRIS
jgi:hypothetical protein